MRNSPGRTKSNHRALVAAVFVGLLSVVINQTFATNPEIVDSVLQRIEQYGSLLESRPADVDLDPNRTPTQLLESLEYAESNLSKLYQRWKFTRTPADSDQIQRMELIVQTDLTALEAWEAATKEERYRGRLLALNAYFIIAELSPAENSKVFLDYCQTLMQDGLSKDQVRTVELLRAYHMVNQADELGRLNKLREYAQTKDPAAVDVGAELHLIVAQDLVGQRQVEAAREVLQQGLRVYQGHPEAVTLLQELMKLKR